MADPTNVRYNKGGSGGHDNLGYLFGGSDEGQARPPPPQHVKDNIDLLFSQADQAHAPAAGLRSGEGVKVRVTDDGGDVAFSMKIVDEIRDSNGGAISDTDIRGMSVQDLRMICRQHGMSPAGSHSTLVQRVLAGLLDGSLLFASSRGAAPSGPPQDARPNAIVHPASAYDDAAAFSASRPSTASLQGGDIDGFKGMSAGNFTNQYTRSTGSGNQGNFITDTNSKHITQPPGGTSTFVIG